MQMETITPLFGQKHNYIRLVEDGKAVEILLGGEGLKMALTAPHGMYATWEETDPPSLSLRKAEEGEQGLKPMKGKDGYFLRIPVPPGKKLKDHRTALTGREPTWHFKIKKGRVVKVGIVVHRDGKEIEAYPVPDAGMIENIEIDVRGQFNRAVDGDCFYRVGSQKLDFDLDEDQGTAG
jgi:hypothetical protein